MDVNLTSKKSTDWFSLLHFLPKLFGMKIWNWASGSSKAYCTSESISKLPIKILKFEILQLK